MTTSASGSKPCMRSAHWSATSSPTRVTFDLKSVELHFDSETNTSTTAPVVVPAEAPAIISAGPQLSPNQRSMLSLIGGPNGIAQEELFNQAREMGIGRNRR